VSVSRMLLGQYATAGVSVISRMLLGQYATAGVSLSRMLLGQYAIAGVSVSQSDAIRAICNSWCKCQSVGCYSGNKCKWNGNNTGHVVQRRSL
jgi:hypothetical protein